MPAYLLHSTSSCFQNATFGIPLCQKEKCPIAKHRNHKILQYYKIVKNPSAILRNLQQFCEIFEKT